MDGEQNEARQSLRMRQVLQKYDQQLLTARRLARFRARNQQRNGLDVQEPDPAIKRKDFVESVASEMFTALLFTGIPDELMEEIRQELCKVFKKDFEFVFPPNSNLCIYMKDGKKRRQLTTEEAQVVSRALAAIMSQKIDKSMLKSAQRTGIHS